MTKPMYTVESQAYFSSGHFVGKAGQELHKPRLVIVISRLKEL
jgi:hypothetical protein